MSEIIDGVKPKGVLDGAICYLAGPIDQAEDSGTGYRRDIIAKSREHNINIKYLDPTNKLDGLKGEVGDEQDRIKRYRERGRWKDLTDFMKLIVRADLRQVDISDFIIAKIDKRIHMCGTYHEIVVADIEKKPVLLIIEGGKKMAPSWLFGILEHEFMFDNEDECVKYLDKVNRGEVELNDKWILIRKQLADI